MDSPKMQIVQEIAQRNYCDMMQLARRYPQLHASTPELKVSHFPVALATALCEVTKSNFALILKEIAGEEGAQDLLARLSSDMPSTAQRVWEDQLKTIECGKLEEIETNPPLGFHHAKEIFRSLCASLEKLSGS